jgi:autotransporter-associated beta strand protein/probable HAF family extracellular repeat protein
MGEKMNVKKRWLVGSGTVVPGGLLLGGLSMVLPSASGSIYSLTNIGAAVTNATGVTKSFGLALNDSGTVAGTYTSDSSTAVFSYSNGVVTQIPQPGDFFSANNAVSINASGSIAYTYNTGTFDRAAVYSPATGQNTNFPDTAANLGNGVDGFSIGINSAGTVVAAPDVTYSSGTAYQTYVLQNGVETNVGFQFSGTPSSSPPYYNANNYPRAINDSGQIAGYGDVTGTNSLIEGYIATPNGSSGTYTFNNVGALVLAANSHRSYPYLTAINNAGLAVGTFNDYSGDLPGSAGNGPFAYLYNGSKIVYLSGLGGTSYLGVTPTAINNSNQIVGTSSLASARYSTDAFLYQNGNTQDLNNLLDSSGAGWTLTNATGINASGQIVGYGTYNSSGTVVTSAFLLTPEAATLTWNNSHTIGVADPNPTTDNNNDINPTDGITWDVNTTQNWNGGSTTLDTIFSNGDNVTFNDNNNGHYAVTIPAAVQPGSVTVNTANSYTFNGSGGIAGSSSLTKTGAGSLTLSISNSYTGGTNVSAGTVYLNVNGALPGGGALAIGSSAAVIAANHGTNPRFLLAPTTLSISGSTNAWTGKLDLANNDLVVQGGDLPTITNQIKQGFAGGKWNGPNGIFSSTAASNSSHLTALGVILNTTNGTTPLYGTGTTLGLFDGTSPAASAVLVRYTYYGDANLDGKVDASDYSRIDAGYLAHATGWYNGDFNYDGVVNGSDYTLIDNAFNTQSAALPSGLVAPLAGVTSEIAGSSAVPEPGDLALLATALPMLLGRRNARKGLVRSK